MYTLSVQHICKQLSIPSLQAAREHRNHQHRHQWRQCAGSFFWQWNVIGVCCSSHAGISAHLCLSMYQNTLGVTASDSTRYHHVRSTMVHWLLCCGALGTSLIIYPACVYLCWTRLCGGGRQTESCQPACEEPANPEGLLALSGRVFSCVFVCVCVWETEVAAIQLYKHELWSDLHRHRHTHKTFNCQKKEKSLPGSIVSNVFNVNLTLWGHLLLC